MAGGGIGISREHTRTEQNAGGIVINEAISLEVLVEGECTTVLNALLGLLGVLLGAGHDTGLLVVTDTLLEEVGLASERDVVHEVEGVGGVVVFLVSKRHQQTVGNELDVLAHELGVHTKESDGEGIRQELLLNSNGIDDDLLDHIRGGAVVQVGEQQASEVSVQTLVTRDQLVGEGQTRHETTLLQPEDGGERAREEDTLNSSEGNQTLSEGGLFVLDPTDGPVGLLADAGNYQAD